MDYVDVPRLMPDSKRCHACAKGNRSCTFSGGRTACESCHSKKMRCVKPAVAASSEASSSVVSSGAPSHSSSLVRGVAALGVSEPVPKTPSRKDKRKIEVGSSPEDQPARRRSKTNLKGVGEEDVPSEGSSGTRKTKEDLGGRIGRLEKRLMTLSSFYMTSVENLREELQGLRNELAEEESKGKGKA